MEQVVLLFVMEWNEIVTTDNFLSHPKNGIELTLGLLIHVKDINALLILIISNPKKLCQDTTCQSFFRSINYDEYEKGIHVFSHIRETKSES